MVAQIYNSPRGYSHLREVLVAHGIHSTQLLIGSVQLILSGLQLSALRLDQIGSQLFGAVQRAQLLRQFLDPRLDGGGVGGGRRVRVLEDDVHQEGGQLQLLGERGLQLHRSVAMSDCHEWVRGLPDLVGVSEHVDVMHHEAKKSALRGLHQVLEQFVVPDRVEAVVRYIQRHVHLIVAIRAYHLDRNATGRKPAPCAEQMPSPQHPDA